MEKMEYLLCSWKIKKGQEALEPAERRKQVGSRQETILLFLKRTFSQLRTPVESHHQQLRAMLENFKHFYIQSDLKSSTSPLAHTVP